MAVDLIVPAACFLTLIGLIILAILTGARHEEREEQRRDAERPPATIHPIEWARQRRELRRLGGAL